MKALVEELSDVLVRTRRAKIKGRQEEQQRRAARRERCAG
jgi:hypothetical protein